MMSAKMEHLITSNETSDAARPAGVPRAVPVHDAKMAALLKPCCKQRSPITQMLKSSKLNVESNKAAHREMQIVIEPDEYY